MDPHLHQLRQELEATISGFSAGQWTQHAPGKWSAAQILEHLYLTYTGTVKGFERVAQADRPLATRPTWRQRAAAFVVVTLGHMPSGQEAPNGARPRGLPHETVLADIGMKIAQMDSSIAGCEAKLGRRQKVLDHPILGALTTTEWRKFHVVHGLHHLKQLRRLRDIPPQG